MSDKLILKTAQVGPWPMNTYVLICPVTKQSVLIDPGAEPDTLTQMLAGSSPVAILLTHAHADHVGALAEMKTRLQAPVYLHPKEPHSGLSVDRWFAGGDAFTLGNVTLDVIHTPGHTPGMVTLMLPDGRAIVGDTIFQGGPGRTWSVPDFQVTLDTMRRIVLHWPDDTRCYPGHGPSFRLGNERPAIEAFLARSHPDDLQGDVTWDM